MIRFVHVCHSYSCIYFIYHFNLGMFVLNQLFNRHGKNVCIKCSTTGEKGDIISFELDLLLV